MSMTDSSVYALSQALARGEITATALTEAYLENIKRYNDAYGAYLTVTRDEALAQAEAVDCARKAGKPLSVLAGIPYALKDNIMTRNIRTTCASKMLEHYVPPYSATVYERLQSAGCVLLGKTNMDEFAMGSSGEYSAYYPSRNPLDTTRSCGGSSCGSAAAVCGHLAAFALGSDTGGSVRQPAALCGLVGLRPTYGTISRYGMTAFASDMDQIGVLTTTVRDSALVTNALCGHDARDMTTARRAYPPYERLIGLDVRGMRLGVVADTEDEDAVIALDMAQSAFARLGVVMSAVSLPAPDMALAAYAVLSCAQAASNLARFDGVRFGCRADDCPTFDALVSRSRAQGLGGEVKRRILRGVWVLSTKQGQQMLARAQKTRALVTAGMNACLSSCDAILSPASPTAAFPLYDMHPGDTARLRRDLFTVPAALSGLPALCVPCGRTKGGLPLGVQLQGRAFDEATLYRLAGALEREVRA